MATMGRSFVFYLKYWEQMEGLYGYTLWGQNAVREAMSRTLPEKEENLDMIDTIGRRACAQAADFLSKCTGAVQEHFRQFCNAEIRTREGTVQKNWEIEIQLWPRRRGSRRKYRWVTGITIDSVDGGPMILPWIWTHGGRGIEDRLCRILGKKVVVDSDELPRYDGSVIIGKIPIKIENSMSFDLDRDPLAKQTVEAFSKIGKKELDRIFKI